MVLVLSPSDSSKKAPFMIITKESQKKAWGLVLVLNPYHRAAAKKSSKRKERLQAAANGASHHCCQEAGKMYVEKRKKRSQCRQPSYWDSLCEQAAWGT